MTIGLIPARLKSKRLPNKPLIKINGTPLIIHVLKEAQKSNSLKNIIVCADDKKIVKIVTDYGGNAILTSKKHKNGTERIATVASKLKSKFFVDIQCDSFFLNFRNLDKLIKFHSKNPQFDIVVPYMDFKHKNDESSVKIISNKKNEIIYMSRKDIPYNFRSKAKSYMKKHLDYISFTNKGLQKFAKLKESNLEKIEEIELLRALDYGMKIGTFKIKKDYFSINTKKDLYAALRILKKDEKKKIF